MLLTMTPSIVNVYLLLQWYPKSMSYRKQFRSPLVVSVVVPWPPFIANFRQHPPISNWPNTTDLDRSPSTKGSVHARERMVTGATNPWPPLLRSITVDQRACERGVLIWEQRRESACERSSERRGERVHEERGEKKNKEKDLQSATVLKVL